MHPIWLARIDKARPVLVLTREEVREVRSLVTVVPITTRIRGLGSEIPVGRRNGLDADCVANLDLITTISRTALVRPLGLLLADQELLLARAVHDAFDLEDIAP